MASIVYASAALRVRSEQNRAICSISGVNPNMNATDAAGFVSGIICNIWRNAQKLPGKRCRPYNRAASFAVRSGQVACA
jgi:hypothetical protein